MSSAWGKSWGKSWGNSWGTVAPPVPPIPPGGGGGGGSGAFDSRKYLKKEEERAEPLIVCISLHHVGAQWGMVKAKTVKVENPTQQMIVMMFIAQHGSP